MTREAVKISRQRRSSDLTLTRLHKRSVPCGIRVRHTSKEAGRASAPSIGARMAIIRRARTAQNRPEPPIAAVEAFVEEGRRGHEI